MTSQNDSEKIKVAIIDDDADFQEWLQKNLEEVGCIVVTIASNMKEALNDLIPQLENLAVKFVFLDGNLSEGAFNGSEGLLLSHKIREQAPSVRIVGFSSKEQSYVDHQFGKENYENQEAMRKILLGE